MSDRRKNPSVIIMGAGMTGILLAIKLKQAGISNITLLEKKGSIGGTWRENTYPGVACDVPSHAYTYSFEPNPDWSSHFPSGAEIYQYFEKVIHKYKVAQYIRYNEAALHSHYEEDDDGGFWMIKTSKGAELKADLLFSATGILHHPVLPEIQGMESFTGSAFHSSNWDHNSKLSGKRIGVVGTGSTASQIIPQLVAMADTDVTVFQRTAQWTVKMENRIFTDKEKQQFQAQPKKMLKIRKLSALVYSLGTAALTGNSWLDRLTHKLMAWNGRKNLKDNVSDPELRAKLTPNYKFGCKRVVITASFYNAIQQTNAHLVTESINHIEDDSVVVNDGSPKGKKYPLDILVFATGFDASAFMRPMELLGRGGLSINKAWQKKIAAYRSIFLPDFPNFFLMLGPNSPIGNQSVIEIAEVQTDYVLQLIDRWQQGELTSIEAKPEALQQWTQRIKTRMKNTIWTSGCQSWYLDADGDALTWPDTWGHWLKAMKQVDLNDFVTSPVNEQKKVITS
jgi:cation diffusion facilitator CzcD-associated flavoprotein CzcO